MGGPASPFLWCLAYDPIIFALELATGTEPPTYVDDLAGLVWGPAHAMRAQLYLIAAGHLAGLKIDAHHCSVLHAPWGRAEASRILACFPMTFTPHPEIGPDAFSCTGLPGANPRSGGTPPPSTSPYASAPLRP